MTSRLSRRCFGNLRLLCAAAVAALVQATAANAGGDADNAKPNIVLLLADDLGYADVGFNGGKIPTPNIDRIAREGVRLERFYACPVCSPTRAGLMTGRWPLRMGIMRSGRVEKYSRYTPERCRASARQVADVPQLEDRRCRGL